MSFEMRMKERLKVRLSDSFIVKEEPRGYFGDDKIEVRGDLILHPKEKLLEQGFPNRFMIIEIKDDTTKHFQKSELIRQSIFLSLSKFEGKLPLSKFIVTKSDPSSIFKLEETTILSQFNVGFIEAYQNGINSKMLRFQMQAHCILRDNENNELIFDRKFLTLRFKLTVGTKARSNRISLL